MKILLACGGTGGHIFPAISVAEELKRRDPRTEIVYVCGKKDIENSIFKMVIHEKVASVDSAPFGRALSLLKPSFLIKLFQGCAQSWRLLRDEKPQVVVGFGGYFSFPVMLMAKLRGIRTLIHEQNVIPGVANKFLARVVDGVALSYPDTQEYMPRHGVMKVTGNPIRASIEKDCRQEALKYFNFSNEKTTVLVVGGSQGAESINTFFLDALKFLTGPIKEKIQVLHLCGKMGPESAQAVYRSSGIPAAVYSFFQRMDLAYGACDFSVGRAGATFLAEIAAKNIPAILIPYPYGSGHQLLNAQAFCKGSESVVVEQKDMTPEKLAQLLTEFSARGKAGRADSSVGASGNARILLADFIQENTVKK